MTLTPTFKNPPVVEFVLGVQFSPLVKLTTGHFGLLWKELGDEWVEPEDGPPLPDQLEQFDRPQWSGAGVPRFRIGMRPPMGRYILHHQKRDRLIQMQPTRFHLNWRKTGDLKPSYKALIDDFEHMFAKFQKFTATHELGELTPNQWEITYIDSYPQGDYWRTPADWSSVLPGLFGQLFTAPGIALEHRAAEWSYEIEPRQGRLHIAARPGRWGEDKTDSLLVDMTARGPIGTERVSTWRQGLDLGHEVAVKSFLQLTEPKLQEKWERLP